VRNADGGERMHVEVETHETRVRIVTPKNECRRQNCRVGA
jgi:hypothetical protein